MRYVRKPRIVEAVQITDSTFDAPHPNPEHVKGVIYDPVSRTVRINDTEGEIGDWLLTLVDSDITYICPESVFHEIYMKESEYRRISDRVKMILNREKKDDFITTWIDSLEYIQIQNSEIDNLHKKVAHLVSLRDKMQISSS